MPCWSFLRLKKKGRQNKGSKNASGQRSDNTSGSFKEASVVPDLKDVSITAGQKRPCWRSWWSHCCQKVRRCLKRKDRRIHPEVQSPGAEPKAEGSASPTTPTRLTIDDFVFHKVLGRGTSGTVLLAELKDTGEYFAVKEVLCMGIVESIMVEKRVLTLAGENPFLSHLYSTFQHENYLFFVMEYLSGGDLNFHINDEGHISLKRTTFYAAEMVVGLQFLHSRGIIHRDLKPGNVMLDSDGHIKIVDFGFCMENMFGEARTTSLCGTPAYIAPEILLEQEYNSSVDWWSFGVTLYEMLTGQFPFAGDTKLELAQSIMTGVPMYPDWINKETKDLLMELLERDPSHRLGVVGNIRAHPFFKEMDWAALEKREVEPPFKPKVKAPNGCCNVDSMYQGESPSLSCVEDDLIHSSAQAVFAGFSFMNSKLEDMLDRRQETARLESQCSLSSLSNDEKNSCHRMHDQQSGNTSNESSPDMEHYSELWMGGLNILDRHWLKNKSQS